MKRRVNKIQAGKRAPWWALAVLAGSLFIGCSKETITPPIPEPETGDATLLLSVHAPGPTLPAAFSRSQTESESLISTVNVLVFETGTENIFSYMIPGLEVSASADRQTRFKVELIPSENPLKIVILANAEEAFEGAAISAGMTEDEVRGELNAAFSAAGLRSDLPMYGEAVLAEGVDPAQTYNISVTALRAVARVDVVKELVTEAPEFILEEVYAFRANDRIRLIPDAPGGGNTPKVTAPSVPESAVKLDDPVTVTVPGGTESITQLYLPESLPATNNTEKIYGATAIVIGGRFGGAGNPVTYYRADFNSGIAGHPFGQILRNHRYIFNIKRVGAEGWPTPEEAADHLSSSISVDVQTWEDFSSELYYGDDRFAVSAREISLRYTKDRQRGLDVESTLSYRIQWLDAGGNPTGNATSAFNTPVANGNFEATIVPGSAEHTTRLLFRTLNHNHLGADAVRDKLRITAGKWSVDITVKQEHSALYSDRILNILTVAGIGNLGVDMVAPDANGLAMRRVLDNRFAPAGTIRIGGFSFTRIPNTAGYVGTSDPDNLAVLNRIFGAQDVIYLPYGVALSSEVADLLLAWLETDTRRVLMIGIDSDGSNKQLRLKAKVAADGTFGFTGIPTITSKFMRAASADRTGDFFDGPFGAVAESASFNRADDITGYIKDISSDVIPLITSDKTGYEDHVFFGVNAGNRIIYNGDGQFFQSGRMSNDNGEVSTDLDRLMANTWAWIVEQILYGTE